MGPRFRGDDDIYIGFNDNALVPRRSNVRIKCFALTAYRHGAVPTSARGFRLINLAADIDRLVHVALADLDDPVAGLQPFFCGRTAGIDIRDDDALGIVIKLEALAGAAA